MASFEQHCKDCELLLGNRHEALNKYIDSMFKRKGPRHRVYMHHWTGVENIKRLFGDDAALAAIVHIVRDCGGVPRERDYEQTTLGIMIAPEYLMYDGNNRTAQDKFKAAVEKEWEIWKKRQ